MKPEQEDAVRDEDLQPQPAESAVDPVQIAEEQSFPASDPPSWWSG